MNYQLLIILKSKDMKKTFLLILLICVTFSGVAQSTSLSGSGTAGDPYLIQSLDDLKFLRDETNKANGETSNYRGNNKHFKLTTDIDLSNENWAPIGVYSTSLANSNFQGVFDGNGHSISNLKIGTPTAASVRTTAGLFGTVRNGKIHNLFVLNAAVYQTTNTSSSIELRGAILIGNAEATTVDNCKVSGIMNAKNITTTVKGFYIGGIIGEGKDINIYNSSAYVDLTGSALVGTAARAASAGGLVGRILQNATNGSNIKNCYSGGTIISESSATTGSAWSAIIVAGIVANVMGTNAELVKTSLENCVTKAKLKAISTATSNSGLNIIAAGIVGSNNTGNLLSGCIAENDSIITQSSSTIDDDKKFSKRIVGNGAGSLSNNFAANTLIKKDNSINVLADKGPDTNDGEDLGLLVSKNLINNYVLVNTSPAGISWNNWVNVYAESNDVSKGTVQSLGNLVFSNEKVTLWASPNPGNKFTGWKENNVDISSDAVFSFVPGSTTDRYFVAQFIPDVVSATDNPSASAFVQFNGKTLKVNEEVIRFRIYDSSGKLIANQYDEKIYNVKQSGIYIIEVELKNTIEKLKFVIQ
jgi:hypothetical protein